MAVKKDLKLGRTSTSGVNEANRRKKGTDEEKGKD